MSILTKPYMQTGNAHLLPIDMNDPTLVLYLPLWYPHGDMTGSPIYSYDINRHSCTVTGAVWGSQGRTFGTDDEIETPSLGLTDANDYTICEWFEGHFRVLINEGGVGKTYYVDGVLSDAFPPSYSITTNKIMGIV